MSVEKRGLEYDRRWMVMDAEDRFLTGRTHPHLLSIEARGHQNGAITLSTPGRPPIDAYPMADDGLVPAQVWSDESAGWGFQDQVNDWLSTHLGEPCTLVYMPDSVRRLVSPQEAFPGAVVSYADGYPLLMTSEASFADLNQRLKAPVSMANFRPNLVVSGARAFDEFEWKRIRIGQLEFESGGACVRCILTTIDPMSGVRRPDGEPLKTLATYQKTEDGVLFGINLVPLGTGELRVGDPVTILE
jgi:uncharacterized protein YcbX